MPPAYLKAGLPEPETDHVRGCTGKLRHDSYSAAVKAKHSIRHKTRSVYRCPNCHGWHLGNDRFVAYR